MKITASRACAASQNGSNAGSSRYRPLMFEAISAPGKPSPLTTRSNSVAHTDRILKRDGCERDKALRKFSNRIAQAIIQPAGKFKRIDRRKPIEKIGTRWRQGLHTYTLLVHNRKT